MKLYCDDGKGRPVELMVAGAIGEGDIVIRLNMACGKKEIKEMEEELSEKLGRKVILLDSRFGEILTLPPENGSGGVPRRP